MNILAVIPARFGSQRFPGKPLVKLGDRPLIQWVYEAAQRSPIFDRVIVATDHEQIAQCVTAFGGTVEFTQSDHPSGTDRVAEVASRHPEADVIVNVQGDQPFVTVDMLAQLVSPFQESAPPEMTTLACPITSQAAFTDPNIVKVVCNQQGDALYFSRSAIPYFRYTREAPVYHHLGLYAFRRDFLSQYASLHPTPLEQCEALEQLRVLEHGYRIRVCHTPAPVLEPNPASTAEETTLCFSFTRRGPDETHQGGASLILSCASQQIPCCTNSGSDQSPITGTTATAGSHDTLPITCPAGRGPLLISIIIFIVLSVSCTSAHAHHSGTFATPL
jgi:3-deoxy-manno-octulosonate cytidylyltransferase (CMP-KDO synthetase)